MFEAEEKLFDYEYDDILSLWKVGPLYCAWYIDIPYEKSSFWWPL